MGIDYEYVLSFDPGKSNGIALGRFSEETPYELVEAWQVEGGVVGLVNWVRDHFEGHREDLPGRFHPRDVGAPARSHNTVIVSEKFTPLQNKGFAQTLDSTEPLRGEGALIALGVMPDYPDPTWRRPNVMYLYGGKDKREKLKNARAFLKEHGMLTTGKMVGCKDANDSVSATLHGISYVAQLLKHEETMKMILGRGNDD